MKTSDSIIKIAPALLSAQQAIGFAAKDSKNPAFKSSYANLESVIEAIKAPLNDAGIMFLQTFAEAVTGLYQADDDGTAACRPAPKPAPEPTLSADQVTAITDAANDASIKIADICKAGKVASLTDIHASSFTKLINWINSQKKEAA